MKELALKAVLVLLLVSAPAAAYYVRGFAPGGPSGGPAENALPRAQIDPVEAVDLRSPEEQQVVNVVQAFFDALASRDTASLGLTMVPEGRLVRIATGEGAPVMRITSRAELAESLVGTEAHFLERMWDAQVALDGPMATVWAPYDFHVDREFSHCGIDVFDLYRSPEGWKIVSVTYTRHPPSTCGESPLGAP